MRPCTLMRPATEPETFAIVCMFNVQMVSYHKYSSVITNISSIANKNLHGTTIEDGML